MKTDAGPGTHTSFTAGLEMAGAPQYPTSTCSHAWRPFYAHPQPGPLLPETQSHPHPTKALNGPDLWSQSLLGPRSGPGSPPPPHCVLPGRDRGRLRPPGPEPPAPPALREGRDCGVSVWPGRGAEVGGRTAFMVRSSLKARSDGQRAAWEGPGAEPVPLGPHPQPSKLSLSAMSCPNRKWPGFSLTRPQEAQ